MNEPVISKVNKDAQNLLDHLFYDKIVRIESDSKERISFSKQAELKKRKDEVNTFIERNPYSNFEVRVLHKEAEDKETYKVALSFSNYKETTDKRPNSFLIIIDAAFNSITYYQWSLNHILLPL